MAKTPKAAPLRAGRQRRAASQPPADEAVAADPALLPVEIAPASPAPAVPVASVPDLFEVAALEPKAMAAAPAPAAPPKPEAAPAPEARAAKSAGKAAKGASLKAGVGLKMVTPEGEESIVPFKSVEDLLSGIKPYLRDAARSPEPVWFCLEKIDLANFDPEG